MKVFLLLAAVLPFISGQDIPGGQHSFTADVTDPNVVFAVNAINELYKTNGDNRPRVAEKVISATSQVVSGVIYRYTILVLVGDVEEECTVAVWSRPWLTGSDSTGLQGAPKCVQKAAAAPPAVSLVGGEQAASLSDEDVQKAVHFLESKLNSQSNSLFYLKVAGVTKVTKQVVNGIIYRFYDASFVQSSCTQNEVKLNAHALCAVSPNAKALETCTSEVYWNPREAEEYTLKSNECNINV